MLFVLRVVLVVGVLSYLALLRQGADPDAEARKLAGAASPAETRDRVMRDVLARGLMAELSRRAGQPDPGAASQDTLSEADRAPAWRGVDRR